MKISKDIKLHEIASLAKENDREFYKFINFFNGKAYATNGFILAEYPLEAFCSEQEANVLEGWSISAPNFKQILGKNCEVLSEGFIHIVGDDEDIELHKVNVPKFIGDVAPKTFEGTNVIGFSPQYLDLAMKLFANHNTVKFSIAAPNRAVVVEDPLFPDLKIVLAPKKVS